MSKVQMTTEQRIKKGYLSAGMINGAHMWLPLHVNKSAARIKDAKARNAFLADTKAEYLERAQNRSTGEDSTGPIVFEVTPNGRALLKVTGTRRWAFFSKEQLELLISPSGIKAARAVISKLPDSVQTELEVESAEDVA